MIQTNPLGIFLGAFFVACIGALFLWMFRVPPALPLNVVKVHRSLQSVRKILVPIIEAIPSERAVEVAWRIGHEQKAELALVHVIVVPYTLSLNAAMPDREKIARETLEFGRMIAERLGCHARTHVVRHRHVADGVLQIARDEQVDAIVLGVGVKRRLPGEWSQIAEDILRRAPCEVVVDKVPIPEEPVTFGA